jgi:hypothetical protein
MSAGAIVAMVIIFGLMGFGAYLLCRLAYLMIRTALGYEEKTPETPYRIREKEFKSNMDERQHIINAQLRGASMVEVWMTFEARLYALEQRVLAAEQRNQDDGK